LAHILLVEDDREMARLLRVMVAADGHTIDVCADGLKAIALAQSRPVELVLLDVNIPGCDGIEVCRQVRAAQHADRRPTVVMITGRHDTASKLLAFSVGADDYLVKPFDVRELRTRVARWLDLRQQHAETVLRRRREAIQEIVAAICHEVNNPLTVAMMGVDLLMRRPALDRTVVSELDVVWQHLERITAVVASLQSVEDRTVPYLDRDRMIDLQTGTPRPE
jgi:DNA-binding response OmpR family regulator